MVRQGLPSLVQLFESDPEGLTYKETVAAPAVVAGSSSENNPAESRALSRMVRRLLFIWGLKVISDQTLRR
jgi:hypothetical protein